MLIIDELGWVRACGEALAGLLGYDADELVGQPVWMLLPGWSPYNGMGEKCALRAAAPRASVPVRVCGEALHLSGETLFMLDLRRSPAVAPAVPHEATMITDRRGEIRYVNAAFEALTGYSSADVAGLTPAFLRSGAHEDRTYRDLWDTILDGRVYRGMLINMRKDGEFYHEDKVIRPVLDARGRPALFLSSGHDASAWMGDMQALLRGCATL